MSLKVSNRTTWENLFKNSEIKNCDVILKPIASEILPTFNKTNIKSISTTLRNNFVLFEYPTEQTKIEIQDWSNIDDDWRNYLSTTGNILKIFYVVNGVQTIGARVCAITGVEVDYSEYNATLTCTSYFETLNFKKGVLKTNTNMPKNTQAILENFIKPYNNQFFGENSELQKDSGLNYFNIFSLTSLKNNAELLENIYVGTGGSGRFYYDGTNGNAKYVLELKEFDRSATSVNLDSINVRQYANITRGEKPSSIVVQELSFGETSEYTIEMVAEYPQVSTYRVHLSYPSNQTNLQDFLIEFQGGGTNTPTYTSDGTLGFIVNNDITLETENHQTIPPYSTIKITYKANEVIEPSGDTNENAVSIKSMLTHWLTAPAQSSKILSNATSYLSNTDILDMECRIDPTLEPLDLVRIGSNYISLEEVQINFNGGFSGKLKGRIIGQISTISWLDYDVIFYINPAKCDFVFRNTSNTAKTFTFVCGDWQEEITINANSTKTLSSNDYEWIDTFMYQLSRNQFSKDINAYVFEDGLIKEEENLADYYYPPLIYNFDFDETGYGFSVRNPNNFDVELHISGSTQNIYVLNIPARSVYPLNDQTHPNIANYFSAKQQGGLGDDLVCYFEDGDGNTSGTTIILEEDW